MKTNKNCVIRLSKYKNALNRLQVLGFVKVFSDNLADAIGVTASQVRKDFSIFGISGNKRGGYKVEELIERINNILGKNELNKVIIVGVGKLGMALLKYKGFEKEGIKIVASFDIDSTKYVSDVDIPVLPFEELNGFVRKNNIRIGIIAVPDISAQLVADSMFLAGIKGILNFAPIRLKCPEDKVLNNVNMEVELENLIYFVNVLDKTRERK
jgi:redox-sensing transcriptional repressor